MTVVKLEIMKGNPICLFIFVLISLLIGTSDNLTFAGYNVYQSQSVMNGMSEFALANVEALASSSEKGPHWTGYAYNNIKNCCEYVGRYWSECSGAFDACKA